MLQNIRENFTGTFAAVLLGLLAVSFVFFGVGNFNFLNAGYAAKVDDLEISIFQLENAYQDQLLQLEDYSSLPSETLQLIRSNTLDRLIRDAIVEIHVAEQGYRVGDAQLTQLIQEEPQFQEDGVFSKDLYYSWLDQRVIDARFFEERQRQAMRTSQLQRGIGATAFITPTEYRRYLNLIAEQRIVSIATFDIAALADTIVVHDEDVQAHYETQPNDFLAPESVDFSYLEINREELAADITVVEDVLEQYYDDNASRFLQDESRRGSHILITLDGDESAAEELAMAITVRAQAGESFADLAQQYSQDGGTANQGGDLGSVMQSQMPGALGDEIFSISLGEISGPVRTDFGFHVVKLNEIIPGGPLPLSQVRSELLRELRTQGIDDRIRSLERQLADAVFDADQIATISEMSGLELRAATDFTRLGGAPFGANQVVIDMVFSSPVLSERQISDVIEIGGGRSIMVQVYDYHEESIRPLEEVRDSIVFDMQSERAVNIIDDRSRRLREALEDGQDFEEVAFELEANYRPDVTVTRAQDDLDTIILDSIFLAKKPSPGNGRLGSTVSSTGDYVVFMLKAVMPGKPESIPIAERDQRKEELQSTAGASDYIAYVNELERHADIERSEIALQGSDFL
ncbi:MAG: hypothetical protein CMO98_10660 [Woeseia sp.]|nr:hypothetical protein [Woeseia sp.]